MVKRVKFANYDIPLTGSTCNLLPNDSTAHIEEHTVPTTYFVDIDQTIVHGEIRK